MTDKHQFLVSMLDGMNNTVSSIEQKVGILESRVKVLEENEDKQSNIAQGIFQAVNKRQNQLEHSLKEHVMVINNLQSKCDKVDELSARVVQMEHNLEQRNDPQASTSGDNLDIAIYGLPTYDDVTASVNRLFGYMNMLNI